MIIKVALVLAVLAVVLVVIVSTRPSEFRLTRSTVMTAPASAVFAQVNDLHNWNGWSPWAKLDPAARNSFEGPASGVGAEMSWSGNRQVGEGRMTIIESRPHDLVRFKLEFLKPFAGTNTAEFTFKSQANETVVTWSMWGVNKFMGKAIGLVMDCDKMVGGQFEKGLAQMKAIVELQGARH